MIENQAYFLLTGAEPNRKNMNRIQACCLFLVILLTTGSCEKQTFSGPAPVTGQYSEPVLLPITAVNGPYHAYPNEQISLSVTYIVPANYGYVSFPSGGIFSYPGVNYDIGVYGSYQTGGAYTESYYVTDSFYFLATEPGWYYLNFRQPDGSYFQHIISVY